MAPPLFHSSSHEPTLIGSKPHGRIRTNSTAGTSTDSRREVRFHDNPRVLTDWCKHLQSNLNTAEANTHSDGNPGSHQLNQPRLNIAIHIAGSRGDVQPFIPIAKLLSSRDYGHRVRICTHSNFRDFVESQGVEFFNIGGDPEALMAYMVKNPGLWPSYASLKAGEVNNRRKEMWNIMNGAWRSCIEAGDGMGSSKPASRVENPKDLFLADLIIANPPSMAHIHCAEKLHIPLHMVSTMPWSPTESFPHPLAAISFDTADKSTVNYLSYYMVEMLTWEGLIDLINKLRVQVLHLDPVSPTCGSQLLLKLRVPYNYLWSSAFVPKPADWGSHLNVSGFSFLPLADSYNPPHDLTAFLESGPPPIYIGFGSIVVHNPEALTNLVFAAIQLAGVRAVVSTGLCGVGSSDHTTDSVYLVGDCPHDWLFPRVSAVVHHGGAGTTAAGIRAGKSTVIVPFFGDQPFWGQMIARAQVGPWPVPYKELTAEKLAESITIALQPQAQEAAKRISKVIEAEAGAANTTKDILSQLNLIRCDLCPERLATWEHMPSGARLSGLAAACLMKKNLVEPCDMKLLCHTHWYVEDSVKHPLVGGWVAISNFITAFEIATNDYLQRLEGRKTVLVSLLSHEDSPMQTTGIAQNRNACVLTDPVGNLLEVGEAQHDLSSASTNINNLEAIAIAMTKKSGTKAKTLKRISKFLSQRKADKGTRKKDHLGKAGYVTHATGRYFGDVSKACLKTPAAFCYNVANGFWNMTCRSCAHKLNPRRRGEILGLKSGFQVAYEEFIIGLYRALTVPFIEPYLGARYGGFKGLALGTYVGFCGLACNLGVATFAPPGYFLKGLEKEISRNRLIKIQAECILIRLRQAIHDYESATPQEIEQILNHSNSILQSP